MGDYYSAIANYEHVLEYHQSPIIFYNLGCAHEANDEPDKAISAHLKAITMNENFPYSYKKLGMLFMARQDRDDAIEYFENYLDFDVPQEEKDNITQILERLK